MPKVRPLVWSMSVASLVDALRTSPLLGSTQRDELTRGLAGRFPDPHALAGELVRLGWLTAYQAEELLRGRGPGLVLGSYVLMERLGAGGMGQVFKARHQLMKRVVPLKIIRPELVGSPDAVRRFRKEIEAVARLSHPNVVVAHDAEQVGGRHFLVMEYCPGPDLAGMVRETGPLPVGLACEYVRQAAQGLQHAHERGVLHRDVKPENLVVVGGVVKVLDLGLARLRQPGPPAGGSGALTGEGSFLGTPDYMAPEQARDPGGADGRADLYSLGCTLYFVLGGQVPFPGGTALEKVLRHQLEEPHPLQQLRAGLPPALAAVVRRAMAKDPADRFQTAAELAAALEPFARAALEGGGPPTLVEGPTVAAPPLPPPRPRPWGPGHGRAETPADRPPAPTLPDEEGPGRPRAAWPKGAWVAAGGLALVLALVFAVLGILNRSPRGPGGGEDRPSPPVRPPTPRTWRPSAALAPR
jgi:serine/threonine-protein kinase